MAETLEGWVAELEDVQTPLKGDAVKAVTAKAALKLERHRHSELQTQVGMGGRLGGVGGAPTC